MNSSIRIPAGSSPREFAESVATRPSLALRAAETGWLPDVAIRWGIRARLDALARDLERGGDAAIAARTKQLYDSMDQSPIAVATFESRAQHYELPPSFFELVLGPRRKYSCGFWPSDVRDLASAECAALELVFERARLADGQRVLELGCGWGSFCLNAAERYPRSHVTAVSHSRPQRAHIEDAARTRGITNLQVVTADMNDFVPSHAGRYDRVVSIEMFEHMRNWRRVLDKTRTWLVNDGLLFLHVFCHRRVPYLFTERDSDDWMARNFFTGGVMPAEHTARDFGERVGFAAAGHWYLPGTHYARTAEAWLQQLDRGRVDALQILEATYGSRKAASCWLQRWRMFFLACAELWGYHSGEVWGVSHDVLMR